MSQVYPEHTQHLCLRSSRSLRETWLLAKLYHGRESKSVTLCSLRFGESQLEKHPNQVTYAASLLRSLFLPFQSRRGLQYHLQLRSCRTLPNVSSSFNSLGVFFIFNVKWKLDPSRNSVSLPKFQCQDANRSPAQLPLLRPCEISFAAVNIASYLFWKSVTPGASMAPSLSQ